MNHNRAYFNIEDPIFEPHYEYKGQDNYQPTSNFLRKAYLALDVQISIVLALHILFGGLINLDSLNDWPHPLWIGFGLLLLSIVVFALQTYFGTRLQASLMKCLVAWTLRTIFFYLAIRIIFALSDFKKLTMLITLILSVHLVFTVYVFNMGTSYQQKRAVLYLLIWMVIVTGLLYFLKRHLAVTADAISVNASLTVLYGLFLIYETGFILDGNLYNTDHCESVFGAFILQYDLAGLIWLCAKEQF